VLRTVIEFRDRLQQIWNGTSANHARALEQLRSLCVEAEGTGILALREFVRRLPTYVPARSVCGPRPIGSSSEIDVIQRFEEAIDAPRGLSEEYPLAADATSSSYRARNP
jgi:hypothetical protein